MKLELNDIVSLIPGDRILVYETSVSTTPRNLEDSYLTPAVVLSRHDKRLLSGPVMLRNSVTLRTYTLGHWYPSYFSSTEFRRLRPPYPPPSSYHIPVVLVHKRVAWVDVRSCIAPPSTVQMIYHRELKQYGHEHVGLGQPSQRRQR
jgi:hypothetical protein